MKQIQCLNCKAMIQIDKVDKIVRGTKANCECGCIQMCLDKNEHISRWRVINPFDFEDKRIR